MRHAAPPSLQWRGRGLRKRRLAMYKPALSATQSTVAGATSITAAARAMLTCKVIVGRLVR